MIDEKTVAIWNVPLKNGAQIRAATIESGPRKPSICMERNCPSHCCKKVSPILTKDEFINRKFKFRYVDAPGWLIEQAPRAEFIVVVMANEKGCVYLDPHLERCLIFPHCPAHCLAYDCREDSRMEQEVRGLNGGHD